MIIINKVIEMVMHEEACDEVLRIYVESGTYIL